MVNFPDNSSSFQTQLKIFSGNKSEGKGVNGEKETSISNEENASAKSSDSKTSDLSPKSRPRSKSDRFARPTRKQVVDVYKQVLN